MESSLGEPSLQAELAQLFGEGLSLYTLARISGVPSYKLMECASAGYCIVYVPPVVLQVIRIRISIAEVQQWPELLANYVQEHTQDREAGELLAELIRVRWAAELLNTSSV